MRVRIGPVRAILEPRLGRTQASPAATPRQAAVHWYPVGRAGWLKAIAGLVVMGLLISCLSAARSASSTFYVSRTGSNTDGRSLATAWNELDQINWSAIQPGDTILISGGTYASTLVVGKSGMAGLPITIRANGKVIIDGGRLLPLPDCDQATYAWQTAGVRVSGVEFGNASYVLLDGSVRDGILIAHHNQTGIGLDNGSSHITVRNVEITDNGTAFQQNGVWRPDQPGVHLAGTNNTFERADIHDNGQDAFQSSSGLANFTIRDSWLYNLRPHPSNPSLSFNYCMHSDGIQVYGGGVQSGVTIVGSILGPGLMQGTILGQSGAGGSAEVDNVTISNVLILDTTNANIMGYPAVKSKGWHIDHLTSFHTSYDPDAGAHHALFLEGSGNSMTNSIIYGGNIYLPDGLTTSGNIQFNVTGDSVGADQDPGFTLAPAYSSSPTLLDLVAGDYSSASGKGSSVTSVRALLNLPPATATPTPGGPPTATGQPTQSGEPTPTSTASVSSVHFRICLPMVVGHPSE